jgi:DNA-binding MarR family transcriptional regulator
MSKLAVVKKPKESQVLESDPFDGLLGYHLRRLSIVAMTDLTESLASLGLKPADASVLFVIGSNSGLTQSDIGRTLGILRANMTPLMAALVKRRLVERERVDGRSQALRLTAAGQVVRRQAWQSTKAHEARMFGSLSPAAHTRMITQLRTLWQTRNLTRELHPHPTNGSRADRDN